MPTPLVLPSCVIQGLQVIFPTVDFSLVSFYSGFPIGTSVGQGGLTLPDPVSTDRVQVFLAHAPSCGSVDDFLLVAHECVHVLQIQSRRTRGGLANRVSIGLANPWFVNYLTCATLTFSSDRPNPYEREAYEYVDGDMMPGGWQGLRHCLQVAGMPGAPLLPCTCSLTEWWATNPNFEHDLLAACPNVQLRGSRAGNCNGPYGLGQKIGWLGAVVDGVLTAASYVLTALIAVATLVLEAVIAVLWLIGAIISFVRNLFSSIGQLTIAFTTQPLHGFRAPITVNQRSSQPPALASDENNVYLAWTGTDDRTNVMAIPSMPSPVTLDRTDGDAGPAVAASLTKALLMVQLSSNELSTMSSIPAASLAFAGVDLTGFGHVAGDSSPALAVGHGRFYCSWIGDDDHVYVSSSIDGVNWDPALNTGERSPQEGTASLAVGFGRLFVAWTGTDSDHHVNVKPYSLQADGSIGNDLATSTLNVRSADNSGPAIAFSVHSIDGPSLYLAWVDETHQLQFAISNDQDASPWTWRVFNITSSAVRDSAGPALATGPGDLLTLAWINRS